MTVIISDGRTIAADSLISFGQERGTLPGRKILIENNLIFGFSGIAGLEPSLLEWWFSGDKLSARNKGYLPDLAPNDGWSMLVIDQMGRHWHVHSQALGAVEVAPPWALGSAADFAIGAVRAGASARRAVEIACEISRDCGLPVLEFNIADRQEVAADAGMRPRIVAAQ